MLTVGTDGKQAGRAQPVPGAQWQLGGVPSSMLVPEWRKHHSDTRAPAMATVCPFTQGTGEEGLMISHPIHETDEETEVSRSTVTSFQVELSFHAQASLHCPGEVDGDGLAWPT